MGGLDEAWEKMPPPEEVERQLREWGIWDEALTTEAASHRWVRFQGVDFGLAPRDEWPRLRRELLPYEASFASCQHDVGLVEEFPFKVYPKPGRCEGVH